ncbi:MULTISPECIES: hypothetical protein [unclassified Nitrosospira]|uniref:hypothetical protein n=1 Tax=unclassified Nitrosospira TaxID=2609267 RepID=UPI000D324825|nr:MULTISPECIES: hypothetical protein [unclassified Nitrosospira]PTR16166.1 hypothetical protein C8R31_102180 [Nitrosospira sp. Nsp2]WON73831.1 hypothetical protein R5L00_15320 [Nitrosospira sp. Is2]
MSIAWATVVIVVLLLPGFAFFWGLYSPNQVTREVSPASPLAQLAGVVIISFLIHACAYFVINTRLCLGTGPGALPTLAGMPCVDFDEFAALLRIEAFTLPGTPPRTFRSMLDHYAGWILVYFGVTGAITGLLGFGAGKLIENGYLSGFTRHRYLFMLERGRKKKGAELVRAHVLSRTQNLNNVIFYDGILQDFFAKADGTISYIVLHDARTSTIEITGSGTQHSSTSIPLDIGGENLGIKPLLVITSDNIANVYFEPLNAVRIESGADTEILDRAIDELEQSGNGILRGQ